MFKLTINCGNAAFEDDPGAEIARILSDLAKRAGRGGVGVRGEKLEGIIRDANGNRVGEWSCDLEDFE